MALVYIDRILHEHDHVDLSAFNVHRLLLASVVVATKFHDDVFFTNSFYAEVGGVSMAELNILEARLLDLLGWRAGVSVAEYAHGLQGVHAWVGRGAGSSFGAQAAASRNAAVAEHAMGSREENPPGALGEPSKDQVVVMGTQAAPAVIEEEEAALDMSTTLESLPPSPTSDPGAMSRNDEEKLEMSTIMSEMSGSTCAEMQEPPTKDTSVCGDKSSVLSLTMTGLRSDKVDVRIAVARSGRARNCGGLSWRVVCHRQRRRSRNRMGVDLRLGKCSQPHGRCLTLRLTARLLMARMWKRNSANLGLSMRG